MRAATIGKRSTTDFFGASMLSDCHRIPTVIRADRDRISTRIWSALVGGGCSALNFFDVNEFGTITQSLNPRSIGIIESWSDSSRISTANDHDIGGQNRA